MSEIPTRQGEGWVLYNAPWQDVVDAGLIEQVDVVISDPPYDARTHDGGMRGSSGDYRRAPISFDPIAPASIAPALLAVARRWVLCCCALEQLGAYESAAQGVHDRAWKRAGILLKMNPMPQVSGDRPAQACEAVAIMHAEYTGRTKWNGRGAAALYRFGRETKRKVWHETQKPVSLMAELVGLYSDPGEVVFDPYSGSGTTGIAALGLGRSYIGCEINPEWFQRSAEELEAFAVGCSPEQHKAGQSALF